MNGLTNRQREILEFIRRHAREKGFWPSFREIQSHFGFRSINAVMGHLRALEAKGVIARVPGQARTFRLLPSEFDDALPPGALDVDEIPVYGTIAAGYPDGVEQGDALGRLQIDVETAGLRRTRRNFALRVRGDSMIDAGIFDGDTVVVEPKSPRDGDIVVALIDGQSTLKRFISKNGAPPYLKSENRDYPELHPLTELLVQGVANAVVRRL